MNPDLVFKWLLIALLLVFSTLLAIGWPNNENALSLASNFITAVAAVVTACIAFQGLGLWRQQTIFQHKVALAQSIFDGAIEYKRAIDRVRYPFYPVAELSNIEIADRHRESIYFTNEREFKAENAHWSRFCSIEADRMKLRHLEAKASFSWDGAVDHHFSRILLLEERLHDEISRCALLISPEVANPLVGGRFSVGEQPIRSSGIGLRRPDLFDEELSREVGSLLEFMSRKMGLSK